MTRRRGSARTRCALPPSHNRASHTSASTQQQSGTNPCHATIEDQPSRPLFQAVDHSAATIFPRNTAWGFALPRGNRHEQHARATSLQNGVVQRLGIEDLDTEDARTRHLSDLQRDTQTLRPPKRPRTYIIQSASIASVLPALWRRSAQRDPQRDSRATHVSIKSS